MGPLAFLLIGLGAAVGAWSRWLLGLWLNPLFPNLPLGTLAANLIGGYLMGIAIGLLGQMSGVNPEVRLMVTTGFLGGLTTFSTFSAEITTLLLRQQFGWALAGGLLHVLGSLLMTWAGLLSIQALKS